MMDSSVTRRHCYVLYSAIVVSASLSYFVSAQTPTLTVLSRDGRKPIPVTAINNQEYIAVDDVNAAFGTTSREDRLAGGLTITARGQSIVLTADQNVVSVRSIKLGDKADKDVIVLEGLNPGDRVIVEGMQKVRPGSPVNPATSDVTTKLQGG